MIQQINIKKLKRVEGEMEENTETVKEPQYLIQDLCDQIKQLTKKKLNKIQSEINKSTNLSTGVIRKYEGEISKNKPELFLIGCVEVAEKNNLSSNIINQFIAKYIQSFKNNKQYTIDELSKYLDNVIKDMTVKKIRKRNSRLK